MTGWPSLIDSTRLDGLFRLSTLENFGGGIPGTNFDDRVSVALIMIWAEGGEGSIQ